MLETPSIAAITVLALFGIGCEFTTGPLPTEDAQSTSHGGGTTEVDGEDDGVSSTHVDGSSSGPPGEPSSDSSSTGGVRDTGLSCCEPSREPGCVEPGIAECVCEIDRFCCDEEWDLECVTKVVTFGCGVCEGIEPVDVYGGPCCEPGGGGAGCGESEIETCVCEADPYCCEVEWDVLCADLVEQRGCGVCSAPYQGPECCNIQSGPSCRSSEVAECVCAQDAYCCEVQWDGQCVAQVGALGCGPCEGWVDTEGGGSSGSSGDGSSGSSEPFDPTAEPTG